MQTIQFHSAMLMAMMERWDAESSIFSLPMGEMAVTLEDVYHILCLPIKGEIVRYRLDHTEENYRREKVYVIGRVVHNKPRGCIIVRWLLHPIGEVPLVR